MGSPTSSCGRVTGYPGDFLFPDFLADMLRISTGRINVVTCVLPDDGTDSLQLISDERIPKDPVGSAVVDRNTDRLSQHGSL